MLSAMNWLRSRTARVAIAGAMGVSGAAASVGVSATPAFADTHLCESFSPNNCADTSNFQLGTIVTETGGNGRDISYTGNLLNPGVLRLNGASNRCVDAVQNASTVVVGQCSGVFGDLVQKVDAGGGHAWYVSVGKTRQNGHNEYLTGCGTVGGALAWYPSGGIGGCDHQRWDLG